LSDQRSVGFAASLAKVKIGATASKAQKNNDLEMHKAVLGERTRRCRLLGRPGRNSLVRMISDNITTRAQPQTPAAP